MFLCTLFCLLVLSTKIVCEGICEILVSEEVPTTVELKYAFKKEVFSLSLLQVLVRLRMLQASSRLLSHRAAASKGHCF